MKCDKTFTWAVQGHVDVYQYLLTMSPAATSIRSNRGEVAADMMQVYFTTFDLIHTRSTFAYRTALFWGLSAYLHMTANNSTAACHLARNILKVFISCCCDLLANIASALSETSLKRVVDQLLLPHLQAHICE